MEKLGLTDRPVSNLDEESLGVKDYVKALSQFIMTCETPMTISIQADWGAGKTSMMNLVKAKLKEEKIETIWFNTWQFSQFNMGDDLPISLLGQFAKKFDVEEESTIKKSLNILKRSSKVLAATVADKAISGAGGVVDAMFDDPNMDSSETVIALKEELSKAVTRRINNSSSDRVVIFIDDLDRLVPAKAVELLETMKLFLDIPGCVFVLAIDYNVVVKGLEAKFGTKADDEKGKSFFDKIIQLPFNLPVAQYDISKYFRDLLEGKFEYKEEDIELFVNLANNSVGFNPRSMKRLFNSLQLLKMVASTKNILEADSVASAYEKQRILFAILCLQTAYEPMYRFMLKHQSQIDQDFFDIFSELERLKESDFYGEIKKVFDVEEDENQIIRFIEFLNTFYEAIQLASDESEGADENLSEKELENLMRFLSFSSITTSNAKGLSTTSGVFQFKSLVKPFVENELIPQYTTFMDSIHSQFELWADNDSGSIYFRYSVAELEFNFVFWRNSSQYAVGLDHINGDRPRVKRFFQKNLKEYFPIFQYNGRKKYGFLTLRSEKFTEEEMQGGEEIKNEIYQQVVLESMGHLSVLEEYLNQVQPTIMRIHNFIDKLEKRLLAIFTREKGWRVDMGKVKELKSYQTIKITNEKWGKGEYTMYISSFASFFAVPYIGIALHPDFKNADSYQKEMLYKKLEINFDGPSNSNQSFFRSNLDMRKPINGDMYDLDHLGSYGYQSDEEEDEAINYLVKALTKLATYTSDFTKLTNEH